MVSRALRLCGIAFVLLILSACPAFAQRSKQPPPPKPTEHKPVVEYIVVTVLLGVPILLVCRSSRRMS